VKVPLNTFCPVCKSKSQPNRLNRNLGDDEVFCVNPTTQKPLHTFPNLEAVDSYDPNLAFLEAQGDDEEEAPAPTPKPKPAPRVPAPKPKENELEPVPAVIDVRTPMATEEIKEALIEAEATKEIPSLFNTPQPAKVVKFNPPPARKAPGGVLILTVRIPDPHPSYLTAEAEAQHESVEAYFQRMIEHALESRWLY
jgi:hypothetical protein